MVREPARAVRNVSVISGMNVDKTIEFDDYSLEVNKPCTSVISGCDVLGTESALCYATKIVQTFYSLSSHMFPSLDSLYVRLS